MDSYRNDKGDAAAAAGMASAADARKYFAWCRRPVSARIGTYITAMTTLFLSDAAHVEAGLTFSDGSSYTFPYAEPGQIGARS
jgi:hypothetical protein